MDPVEKYVINGGYPLKGEVEISGAKNAAVAMIPAALLVDGVCRIENMPHISDTDMLLTIISELGAKVRLLNHSTVEIDCTHVSFHDAPFDLMRKIRASYYLIGAMLGRFGVSKTTMPGGCNFGERPIDQHIKGMEALGAKVSVEHGFVYAVAEDGRMHGSKVYLDKVSVGATMNTILAAVLASGRTIIENAAKEPHIVDLANFLNSMGADIHGAGTDTIKVYGVEKLHGGTYAVIPDQIEAGTYMVAAAATGGNVLVKNVIPKHLESIISVMEKIGVKIEQFDDAVRVSVDGPLVKTSIKTRPHPGFPTDMQPQISALLCLAEGTSMIKEGVSEQRFQYVDELRRMGADIQVDGKVAVIEGTGKLTGAPVKACDLRAGAALMIAGLAASGVTTIEDIYHIERGYADMEGKLRALGACIEKTAITAEDHHAAETIVQEVQTNSKPHQDAV